MTWLYFNKGDGKAFQQAISEIESTQSDRAAAIVAGTFLEHHLTAAIQMRMEKSEKLTTELFRPSGVLGSFGVKIDIGYLIGLYSEETRRELQTIKDIRNTFAHRLKAKDFSYDRVKSLAANLRRIENITVTILIGKIDRTTLSLSIDDDVKSNSVITTFPQGRRRGSLAARERYVLSCKLFIALLSAISPQALPTPEF
jgi:hypothetical protein